MLLLSRRIKTHTVSQKKEDAVYSQPYLHKISTRCKNVLMTTKDFLLHCRQISSLCSPILTPTDTISHNAKKAFCMLQRRSLLSEVLTVREFLSLANTNRFFLSVKPMKITLFCSVTVLRIWVLHCGLLWSMTYLLQASLQTKIAVKMWYLMCWMINL